MAFCRVSILADNFVNKPGLKAEHGLSCLVQTEARNILFDTGTPGSGFTRNATKMNIELYGIDDIVLSHGHYDHTGGLEQALNAAPAARVLLCPAARQAKYFQMPEGQLRHIGMPDSTLNALNIAEQEQRVTFIDRPEWPVAAGLTLFSLPEAPALSPQWPFLTDDADGNQIQDRFEDELSLLIEGENTACLLVGCCHCGLIPIIQKAMKMTRKPLKHIIGGTHLEASPDAILEQVADFLRPLAAGLYFGHCTGMNGFARLYGLLAGGVKPLGTGTELDFDL